MSYEVMANDTIGFLEAVVGDPAHLVGWSDGGIVGLLDAMARPELVRKLVVISANFDTSGVVPHAMEGLTSMTAGSDDLAVFRTPYEAASPNDPEHWPVVFAKFQKRVLTQPKITVGPIGNGAARRGARTRRWLSGARPLIN